MSLPCHSSSGTSTLFTATFGPGPLGLQLRRIEGTNDTEEMAFDRFGVGFAIVHSMSDGDTAAHAAGVRPGDIIVGCSGARAFRLDPSTLLPPSLSPSIKEEEGETFAVVCKTLTSYEGLLDKIKAHDRVTAPLVLVFCRCPFNHRSHSWRRFLTARDLLVPASEEMMVANEQWRAATLPIDVSGAEIQRVLKSGGVGAVKGAGGSSPFLYVNLSEVQELVKQFAEGEGEEVIVNSFVLLAEGAMVSSEDPRLAKVSQIIDLGGMGLNLNTAILKRVYKVFEANYPECLDKFILFPVGRFMATAAYGLLSFVNEKTRAKFVLTNDLDVVCAELGLDRAELGDTALHEFVKKKGEGVGDELESEFGLDEK